MEKLVRTGLLFDFYGGLLTDKQRKTLELYYGEDWSLSEIAEEEGVSRQAVHDLLHRTERTMEEFEAKLGLVKRFLAQQTALTGIARELEQLLDSAPQTSPVHQRLTNINQKVRALIESEADE